MPNKSTIITRFWKKHVGGYTIAKSYVYICMFLSIHMIITIVLVIWCLVLTILVM